MFYSPETFPFNPRKALCASCLQPYIVDIDPVELLHEFLYVQSGKTLDKDKEIKQFASLLWYLCKLLILLCVNAIDREKENIYSFTIQQIKLF